jgi:beta-galactosidase
MNILAISIGVLFSAWFAAAPAVKTKTDAGSRRITKIINSEWTFNYLPEKSDISSVESPSFDDSKWQSVSVPHTWSTYETTGELHPYIRNAAESDDPYWWTGWGWYRKHFTINEKYSDRRVFIEFEGVMKYCKVWLNGKYLGDHKGGYGSFDFDLTPYIIKGGDNLLVVAVNNLRKDPFSIPPMAAGNFNVYGGIYRDVTLVLKDPLYIPMQGSAAHEGGTFITTPGVTEKSSVVRVQTWVKNDYPSGKNCVLKTTITDASGKIIQVLTSKAAIKSGELYRFDQMSKPVIKPRLWSPEDPYIYKVYSEVTDGKIILDSYQSPFGFRWFRWDYKEDFLYVNGKKTILHGGNRHQEYPWLGDAIPKWITEMDFYDMAVNLKYNFMRTAHYPNDKLVYDLTDKYGIIIDEESPSIKNQLFSPEVQDQQMKEMIRRDRNHPSIMLWGMGNETNHAVDSKFAVAEDTTRILTARRVSDGSAGKFVTHTDDNLALENLLRCSIRGWYNSDVKNLSPTDAQHCGTEEHQQNMLISSGRFGTGNLCVWLYEDHGADREYLNAPLLHVNPKGYVDSYRIPKYAYYFWQANYYDKPMVFILPHFWRSQYLGQNKDFNIDSNCDTVELFVNGISQGFQYPDNKNFHNVTFRNIPVQQGTISATGRLNGKEVSASVTMAGEPSKIVVTASHKKIRSDLSSVVIIKADITDKDGNHIYGATNSVRWNVRGPASPAGPQAYESDINKHHDMEGTMYIDMPVANVIRSTGKPGTIIVTVSSPGLASGSCEIIAEESVGDNSVITEPIPDERGRMKVAQKTVTVPVKEITKELKDNQDEIILKPSGRESYSELITGFILKANAGIDSSTLEFKTLTGLFVNHLVNNNGRLIADDYNFFAEHYNICREIAKFVNNTWLPAAFKLSVRKYYSNKIILEGMNINVQEEEERIKAIPTEGNIVYVQDKDALSTGKSGVLTNETDLAAIVALVHPEIKSWEPETRAKVVEYVAGINPYIQTTLKSEVVDNKKITKSFYKVEKGEPIWVPAISYFNK